MAKGNSFFTAEDSCKPEIPRNAHAGLSVIVNLIEGNYATTVRNIFIYSRRYNNNFNSIEETKAFFDGLVEDGWVAYDKKKKSFYPTDKSANVGVVSRLTEYEGYSSSKRSRDTKVFKVYANTRRYVGTKDSRR